jgi:hypothetical protein
MTYNVLSATLPSLSMFLASAHTGLLELGATDKMASTYGSSSRSRRTGALRSERERGQIGGAIELAEQVGTSTAAVSAVRRGSLESDDSERAIIRVERTVSLRYER